MGKTVTIDLRTAALLGPSCKFFELLKGYEDKNYQVVIIDKDWANTTNLGSGTKFDKTKNEYKKGSSIYLWDANLHPRDIIDNLIIPTFRNVTVIRNARVETIAQKLWRNINYLINPYVITYLDFGTRFLEADDLRLFYKQRLQDIKQNLSVKTVLSMFVFMMHFMVFRHLKIYAQSTGFRYELSEQSKTQAVTDFIRANRHNGKTNILISVLWDEGMVFEKQEDRLRGGPAGDDNRFAQLVSYVKSLDDYAVKHGNIQFVLTSKKAVDWSKLLKSDYIDIRNFETLGFSMAQSIYIAQELSDITINWPSTYSIWITNCSDILHLNWHSRRDVAAWARNDIVSKGAAGLIEMIETASLKP